MARGCCSPALVKNVLGLVILFLAFAAPPGFAATYTVTKTADTNDGTCDADCSLREAVVAATASGGADIITLPAGTYTLSLGQMTSNNGKLTINGAGSGTTIIDGNNASRIFDTGWSTAEMEFNDVKLTQGNAGASADGGCIIMRNQPLTINDSIFSNCTARHGGAVYSDQPITVTVTGSTFDSNTANSTASTHGGGAIEAKGVTVTNSTFSNNQSTGTSRGGAIYSPTTVSVTGSTFSNNQLTTGGQGGAIFALNTTTIDTSTFTGNTNASGAGGAVHINAGTGTITDSTFSSNTATAEGGAIYAIADLTISGSTFNANTSSGGIGGAIARYGIVNVTNSTFSGNSSSSHGGAIRGGNSTTIKYSTFYNNSSSTAGGGGGVYADSFTTVGTIFSGNTANAAGDNCAGSATSTGYNIDYGNTCGFTPTTGDVTTDPLLQALADNGGPTKTHAVTSGPALDGGPATCTAATGDVDQRGETRPQGSNCDIGAYEHIAAAAPTNTFTSGTYNSSTNTLVFTGTNFDTIAAVSTDVKTYMDWTKFSWDVNGDDATTANISVVVGDVTSLTITNASTLTLVFTSAKANSIEATVDAGIPGGTDTIDITAGFSKNSGGTPATTDALADGTFTIDSNGFNVTKIADTAGNCTLSDCSLREAISAANADTSATPGSPHIINIPADASPYAITLTGVEYANASGDFDVKEDIRLIGAGAGSTTISGQSGGGDYVFQAGPNTISFEEMTITNNGNNSNQASGGCVYSDGGTLSFTNTTVDSCKATNGGGVMVTSGSGTITLTGSTFSNNVATNVGGAIRSWGITVDSTSFIDNTSTGHGGGIFNSTNAPTIQNSSVFKGNDAGSNNGGAIYSETNINITDSTFGGGGAGEGNTATGGGAVFATSPNDITIDNSSFIGNTASNIGGAIRGYGITIQNGATFQDNLANNDGGAIFNSGTPFTFNGTILFDNNDVLIDGDDLGGAIYAQASLTLNDTSGSTTFQNNDAKSGGAIFAENGYSITGTNVTFKNNTATVYGGALRVQTMDFNKSTFSGNSTTGGGNAHGGAVYSTGAITLTNSTFSANTANTGTSIGGAIYSSTSSCAITNSTFYNDTAATAADVLRIPACTLINTIIYSTGTNVNCHAPGNYSASSYSIENKNGCDFVTASPKFNQINTDPLLNALADNGGLTETHSLQPGSPAIDYGDNGVCTASPVNNIDQIGTTRDTGEGKCDVGAYEGSVAAAGPTNTFTSGTYNSATNTLVLTGTGFDTIAAVSTDVKTYMDWTKFSWDINGDNATTANISVAEADATSLTITNATTLTLVFTTTKANSIEATAGVGIDGNADTLDITAGFSRDVSLNAATTDGLADGTFTIDSNQLTITKAADTADGACTLADCSLREAITAANNLSGTDTINIPDNTYTLTGASGEESNASGDLDITESITLAGTSLANTIIDANSVDRIFDIKSGAVVTLSDMTVKRGLIAANGGCVLTNNTLITLNTVKFDTCKGTYGGAVYAAAGFHITASQFASNWATATGGGIYNTGAAGDFYGANSFTGNHADGASTNAGGAFLSNAQIVTIHDAGSSFTGNYGGGSGGAAWVSAAFNISAATTFDSNYSTADAGGAIISKGGTITETTFKANHGYHTGGAIFFVTNSGSISNSTFEGNYVNAGTNQYGGAFYSNTGGNTFTNVTFSGNSAVNGGAIYNAGVCTIKNSTFYDNDATSGTGDHVGCVNGIVTNSVFYSATAPSSSLCYGVPNGTNNYKYNHAGSVCGASSTNADPMLSPLADNGGNTKTHAPYVGSPLLDAGDLTTCTNAPVSNLDQIGTTRNSGDGKCEIGAYEGSVAAPGITISGRLYAADESTAITSADQTVRLYINGSDSGQTDVTDGAGDYTFTQSVSSGDVITVYLEGETNDATTVTVTDGSTNITNLDIYYAHVIVRHDNASSMTNTLLDTADGDGSNAEILFTITGGNLAVDSGVELYVPSSHGFAPGGTIDTTGVDIRGTLDAAANAINVSGNWDVDAAGVFTSTGTVTFDAASGTNTITPGGTDADHDFQNVTFNDATGTATFQLAGAIDADGNFTVTDGIVDTTGTDYAITVGGNFSQAAAGQVEANGSTITVTGDFSADGTTDSTDYNGASLVLEGPANSTLTYSPSSAWQNGFLNLTAGKSGASDTITGNLAVLGVLNVGSGAITGFNIVYLRGDGTPLVVDADANISVGNLSFNGLTQNVPNLASGYDSNLNFIRHNMVATQTGNVTVNTGKNVFIHGNNTDANIVTYNTDGYNLTVAGKLTVGGTGTDTGLKKLDATAGTGGNSTITVGGDFTVTAGTVDFVADTSTVVLNGTGTQAITTNGDAFNNLSITNASDIVTFADAFTSNNFTATTASTQLTFTGGTTNTISGTLDINGQATGTEIVLRSTDTSQYILDVTGGAQAVSFVDVQYSAASSNNITASSSVNSGNNDDGTGTPNWVFSWLLSGTVYTDEGSTDIGAAKTVRLVINGTDKGTAETNVAGEYGFNTAFVATDKVLVYIDAETEDGNTVSIAGGASLTGLDIYKDRLILREDNGGSLTNTQLLAAYYAAGDADIFYSVTGADLTVDSGKELFVWAGDTYAPDGVVNAHDIDINGTFTGGANNINVSGSWDNDAAAVYTSSGSTTFTSVDAAETITSNGDAFGSVIFDSDDATGEWALQDALTASTLTLTDGVLIDNAQTVTVNGNLSIANTASILTSTGTWVMGATGNLQNPALTNIFNELQTATGITATHTNNIWTKKLTMGASSTIGSTWQMLIVPSANDAFDQGAGADITSKIVFSPSTMPYSQKAINITGDIWFNGMPGTATMTGHWQSGASIRIGGAWNSTSEGTAQVLDTNSYNLTAGTDLILGRNGATANAEYAKVLFDAGTHTVNGNLNVYQEVDGPIGYFDLGSSNISVKGNIDFSDAVVTPGTSTVTLNSGSADQTLTTNAQLLNNLILNNTGASGSDDIILVGALDINGDLTITDGDLDISTNDPVVTSAANVSVAANGSIDVSARTANWTFDGTSILTDSSAGQDFEDVVVNGTSLTLASNAKVQTMTITAGILDLASSDYVLEIDGTGTPLSNSGTFTAGTSTVKYTGTTTATNIATVPYSSLQLTPTAATTYSLTGHLTGGNALTGDVTIDADATLTTTGSNYNITLAGDWSNSGSFTYGTGAVTLNGTGQTVNGSTIFYDLTKSVAAADTLTFEATKTTTIAAGGTVTLNGASGQLLTLASSTGSSAWNFVLTDATVTKAIDYISVSWSDASGSHATQKPIEPTNSTDGGNNTDWFAVAAPVITVAKMSVVISDPINGGSNPKRIPGAVVEYSVIPSNSGDASPDANSVYITDPIDTTMVEFYATGGVSFTDGTTSSALALNTVTYSSTASPGPYVYDYTPVPDGDGYDSNITSVKVTTTGTFAFGGAPDPSFTLKFRIRVK